MSAPRFPSRLPRRIGDRSAGLPACGVNSAMQQRDRQFRRLHSCLHPANPPPPPPPVDRSNLTVHRPFLRVYSGDQQRREEQPAKIPRSSSPPTSKVPMTRPSRLPVRSADSPVRSSIREDVAARPFIRRTQRIEERPDPVPRLSTFQRSQMPVSRLPRLHRPQSRPADPPTRPLDQQNLTVRRSVFRSSSKLAPRVPVRPAPRHSAVPSDESRPRPEIVARRALDPQSSASRRAVPQESARVFELSLAERRAAREARRRPWSQEGKSSLPKGSFSTLRQPVSTSSNDPNSVSARARRLIASIRSVLGKPALSKEDASGSKDKGTKCVRFGGVTVKTVSRWIDPNKHVFEGLV
ncbi:hypothetical protein DTO166G4_8255 [Paecilomyces variotii]|nr:hypothetical protein DTO166G4_8255 [Paecilomyces variotii]KAJ9219280.1 hypothetical protein DTO169C6_8403 [Paecilomyces variotii]KAJ9230490.1 hypothetical protein DTO166G5_7270 [Paecilomyces variotii]KAJ9252922.1 hypothetical protein DTO207G8_4442 [Paecilomyces variotii]KAJ9326311.1 hypothetical protein DTO027B3_2625 [Paecilomyces variotii]